ncbi:MAG: hypothetical protein KAW19_08255 [Candidatus Aminicenantes bacterium]|nr:hypothetical protein [Candidatus Aminicenantes bacterium]
MAKKKITDDFKIMANDGSVFTVGELKKFLREEGLKPSDLFNKHDLLQDPELKEAIDQGVEFELEYRDQQAEEELNEEMKKEKEEDEKENFDQLPGGDISPSSPGKRQRKRKESEEEEELFPPGGESSEDTEDDQEDDQGNDNLMPG